jgi:DNA polymerase-1
MKTLVFDIESDDLLEGCTKMHVLYTKDSTTNEKKYWLENDLGWQAELNSADAIVGHNIVAFDLPALKKLFNWEPDKSVKVYDTLILSYVLDYRRFGKGGHSLDAWGNQLGLLKIDFNDYSKFTQEMLVYCERDVDLNLLVFKKLMTELRIQSPKAPYLKTYIKAEHYMSKWASEAELNGWPFAYDDAVALFDEMTRKMASTTAKLESKLGIKSVIKDRVPGKTEGEVKRPKWVKKGCYDHHTAKWFDVDPWSGYVGELRPIDGPFCRVEFADLKLSSPADVKIFLYRQGWKPTEWNYKKDSDGKFLKEKRKRVKSSPKIDTASLELLGGDGALYKEYVSISSRHAILKTWLAEAKLQKDGTYRLVGQCFMIGTPSMRARHKTIANIPSVDSLYGPEVRSLFTAKEGYTMVGVDSAGNQARALAHYINDDEFTDVILNKDIHIYNAGKMIEALDSMLIRHDFTPKNLRSRSKRVFYATLFGGSGAKLWSYLFGVEDADRGNVFKAEFLKAIPGFSGLMKRLEDTWDRTKSFTNKGEGYIPSLAGNKIYVDSKHKLLVYLLQAVEKITCSASGMVMMDNLEAEGIPYEPLIFYHDELDFMVPDAYAERASEIGAEAFMSGPKLVGVEIMDGDGKIGHTWLDVH